MGFSRPDTGMGSLSLLQGIFPTQGSNPGLPPCRQILYQLSYKGSPVKYGAKLNALFGVSNILFYWETDFPDSSVDKESTCNARDPGSIPGLGRSAEEGIGYPLQYSWASLVAQLVKNLPITQECLGWEDPLEKGMTTHFSILAWRIPWTIQSNGSRRVRHN